MAFDTTVLGQTTIAESDAKPAQRCQPLRVLLAGKLTALDAPGGGEVQMLALAEALRGRGIDAQFWRPWQDDLGETDVLHLFGSQPEHLGVARAARRRGVPVVLSPITWFSLANCWREPRPLWQRFLAAGRYVVRAARPQTASWRRELYHAVDLLLPNSRAEAAQLVRLFGVHPACIRPVANGADERFARGAAALFQNRFGIRDFALYAGRIEPRKNQLAFLHAMRGSGVPVVILGEAVPGHERYAQKCMAAADSSVRFIGRLGHGDPLLASAYAACRCLVLASWYETPGLVALEAGMLGKPLVLPRGGSAQEYFGERATYVGPGNRGEIRRAVLAAMQQEPDPALARHVRTRYTWDAVAAATQSAYEEVARRG